MLQQERHQLIMEQLALEGRVIVSELSEKFAVTPDCIRKDLAILEKEGALKRVRGGAIIKRDNPHHIQVHQRQTLFLEEKKVIAQKAFALLSGKETIFLDISTINIELAKLIIERDLPVTIVTNMLDIMTLLMEEGHTQATFIGGTMNKAYHGMVGAFAIKQIEQFHFDYAFLGTVGVNLTNRQIYTYDVDDGLTKEAVLKHAFNRYLVMESAKFNQDGNFCFASLDDLTGLISETYDEAIMDQLPDDITFI